MDAHWERANQPGDGRYPTGGVHMYSNGTGNARRLPFSDKVGTSKALSIAVMALLCTACAGTAHRTESPASAATAGILKVKSVEARVSDKAKEQLADNIKFDLNTLRSTIERTLSASSLEDPGVTATLDVEVTNVYIRGSFTATMFGFFAGADNIAGKARVLDPEGKVLRSFDVDASYALGGFAGGQDSVRLNYLYEKFAELTRDQLRAEK
jgi:hypothetical protein